MVLKYKKEIKKRKILNKLELIEKYIIQILKNLKRLTETIFLI